MKNRLNRRNFILKSSFTGVGLTLGIPYLLNSCNTQTKKDKSIIQESSISNSDISAIPKRKLGSLEVFPVGIGCMNAAWGFGDPMTKTAAAKLFMDSPLYLLKNTNEKHIKTSV